MSNLTYINYEYNKIMTFGEFLVAQGEKYHGDWTKLSEKGGYKPRIKVYTYENKENSGEGFEGFCYFNLKDIQFHDLVTDEKVSHVNTYDRKFRFIPEALDLNALYTLEKEN